MDKHHKNILELLHKLTIPRGLEASVQGFLAMWSGNFFSCKVSPSTAAPHLSVTPEGSDGDFGNLRTSSCAFPALPQRLFYTVLMP